MSCHRFEWRKSSYSEAGNNDCVEVCSDGVAVLIRDSKNPAGPVLAVSAAAWASFIEAVTENRLTRPAPRPAR